MIIVDAKVETSYQDGVPTRNKLPLNLLWAIVLFVIRWIVT